MTDREKLVKLLGGDMCKDCCCYDCEYENDDRGCIEHIKRNMADHLLANGVTFTPAVPGPSEADPNIMELCFHNGERHMKDKILAKLKDLSAEILFEQRIAGEVKVTTFEHVIKILEDL